MNHTLLEQYCARHTSATSVLLQELYRETHLKTLAPQMASGPLQGQLLRFISLMIQPKTVLEIGTFTGYATICLAAGLPADGRIHTIEVNRELGYIIKKYVKKAALENQVTLHLGDAMKIIPQLSTTFDLVFIDAGKMHYPRYYDLVMDKVNSGGYILADNVLWSGKVLTPETGRDAALLDQFNKKIHQDERVENLLLPIRDGLIIARKK